VKDSNGNMARAALVAALLVVGFQGLAAQEVADAVMRGDREAFAELLAQGADVNGAQADGATALHWAAYRNDLDAVRRLLEAGADVKQPNRAGTTPLLMASVSGNAEMIRLLLGAGADPNEAFTNGETALMMAARTGRADTLEVLIEHGAEVEAREDLRGTTALMWAAAYSNPEAVRTLLAAGAEVGAKSAAVARGRRPYLAPPARERIDEFERGVGQAGRSIRVALDEDAEFSDDVLLEDEARLGNLDVDVEGSTDDEASSPAAEARRTEEGLPDPQGSDSAEGSLAALGETVDALAEAVAALAAAGDGGSQQAENAGEPVAPASAERDGEPTARAASDAADIETLVARVEDLAGRVAALAESVAGLTAARVETAAIDAAEAELETAEPEAEAELEAAEIAGDEDEDFEFFSGGQQADWGGLTALIFAARQGDLESARLLIEAGADVNQRSEFGWTALLTATQNRYYRLGAYLLEQGADPNLSNGSGWNPLYIATDNRNIEGGDYPTRRPDMDHLEYIELLLSHGADPNQRLAMGCGRAGCASTETRTIFTHQWLYEEGATPFLRASQSGDVKLLRLLLEHGADPSIPTEHGVTALMVASGIGWVEGVTFEWSAEETLEAVELLLALGADPNARETMDGRTALMGAAHKGRNDVVQLLVDHGADLAARDIGSRDSIHSLAGVTWQAIDYADGLVRVGVQSAIEHPETAALLRRLMEERGLEVPPAGRTLDSICITDLCR
jgi:uncharacterized protein